LSLAAGGLRNEKGDGSSIPYLTLRFCRSYFFFLVVVFFAAVDFVAVFFAVVFFLAVAIVRILLS